MTANLSPVFGFHPSSRGFGWIVFEDHVTPVDWGVVDVRGNNNVITRAEKLLDKHRPKVFALESFADEATRRRSRIQELCLAVVRAAEKREIAVRRYLRAEIAKARSLSGARTRQDVAVAVADYLTPLRARLPKPRKIWVGERSAMRLFCAAACALTYFDQVEPP
jgi:Holliday junction resolvasome RuvABC endonuclease subunit